MDKFKCYSLLSRIKNEHGVDVADRVRMVAESGQVSTDTLKFINQYYPQPVCEMYNLIREKRRKNPLYKSLVDESLSSQDKAIALSSLLTQITLRSTSIEESKRSEFFNECECSSILDALESYLHNGDDSKLNKLHSSIRLRLKELYNERG